MTLAINCDDDDRGDSGQQSTTSGLEAKKAAKARNTSRPTVRDRLLTELDAYISEPNVEEHSNPLCWWRSNQSRYPSVAVVARSYLGIPATSVASERVFPKCGRVCSERRSLLTPQHVEQLVSLAQNLSDDV